MQTEHTSQDSCNNYDRWNRALADWAVHGSSEGTPIYLSVDEPALLTVARRFAGLTCANIDEACDAFRQALAAKCVTGHDGRIDLSPLGGTDHDGIPRSVAFLAGMVFAAYQMADDEVADDGAYFVRLRQLFGAKSAGQSFRPRGLELRPNRPAPEESLWQTWNRWLARNGFQPTAAQGDGRKYKYSNYPISQALLRKGDKVRLARWFRDREKAGELSRFWDRDLLAVRLPELGQTLSSARLRKLLQEMEDYRHFEAVVDAAAEVYDSIDWDQSADISDADILGPRRLGAGLYRKQDPFTGTIEYWVYPKTPRRWQGGNLSVERGGVLHSLREQRPRWFMPLWPVALGSEQRYRITGADDIIELVLPSREFWILVHDPDDDASSVLASWGVPAPGDRFLLVCQEKHARQLQVLREEELLAWDEVVQVQQDDRVWLEYRECQVESSRWSRMLPQPGCEDLLDALRPATRVNVALEGGLRVPGQPVWIEGHQPDLKLYQFGGTVELRISETNTPEQPVFEGPTAVNDRVPLPQLAPGEYVIEARAAGCVAVRRLQIASWGQLPARQPTHEYPLRVNGFFLRGASLLPVEKEG